MTQAYLASPASRLRELIVHRAARSAVAAGARIGQFYSRYMTFMQLSTMEEYARSCATSVNGVESVECGGYTELGVNLAAVLYLPLVPESISWRPSLGKIGSQTCLEWFVKKFRLTYPTVPLQILLHAEDMSSALENVI